MYSAFFLFKIMAYIMHYNPRPEHQQLGLYWGWKHYIMLFVMMTIFSTKFLI